MKQSQFTFGEKNIETPYLFIKKNIMTWNNTMIQLSNISLLTAADIDLLPFPILALLMILGGFVLFKSSAAFAILLFVLASVWFYFWYRENEKRKEGAILTIRMNSGHNLHFSFEDKAFLLKVVGSWKILLLMVEIILKSLSILKDAIYPILICFQISIHKGRNEYGIQIYSRRYKCR